MKLVVYHQFAAKELVESMLFYEERRQALGEEFLLEVGRTVARIQKSPELGKSGRLRTFSQKTKRFPFRIIYQIETEKIWIVAVAHLARKPGYWLNRAD